MRTIDIWRDPYDVGFTPTRARKITFETGLTVLVGCNGSGKTTLIKNIQTELMHCKVPNMLYNNLSDGKRDSLYWLIQRSDYGTLNSYMSASEGEAINVSLNRMMEPIKNFLKDGRFKNPNGPDWSGLFGEKEEITSNERWLLFDAVDSGLSIDNVVDLKEFFLDVMTVSEKLKLDTYIIISANEYELVDGQRCLDVTLGKYREFRNYDHFKNFILHTREKKDRRYK